MKFQIIYGLLLISVLSCKQETPEFKFEKEGVSFTCPAGWNISEEENIDDMGYYLSVEKDGFNSSGLVSITWVSDSLVLQDYIELYKDELRNNIIYKNSNLNFQPSKISEFNTISSNSAQFEVSILGLKHEGEIITFYGPNKTFVIFRQEAIEDRLKNHLGFEIIEKSFVTK